MLGHLAAFAAQVRVGDPNDPATTMGPVVNRTQFDRVQHYIGIGLEEGGRLVCGGPGRPEGCSRGFYVRPSIFADVTPDITIAREEIFGPVTAVMTYDTLREAMAIANDTAYGLGAYVWVEKYERGEFDNEMEAANLLEQYEARIAALERMVGRLALENDLLKKSLAGLTSAERRQALRDHRPADLSVAEGCRVMGLPRSTFYKAAPGELD